MLIGFGYDIHRLEPGRPMRLGGVDIAEASSGPVAHSDGDVLVHAICDALLGAAALGDIGDHFPDTDPTFRGIDSMELLRRTLVLLSQINLRPWNVDSTLVLEQPRIAPYRNAMQLAISSALGLPAGRVSVKATTNEKLGSIGAGEGVAAFAVVSLSEHPTDH